MLENEEDLKSLPSNIMQIAILHPSPPKPNFTQKIIECAPADFKERLKFSWFKTYKDIYTDLDKHPFNKDSKNFKKGLINKNWLDEIYNRRPALIIYFHFTTPGADRNTEERKIYENLSEMKKCDELIHIILFIIRKDKKENPFFFNFEEERPFNIRKLIDKELIYEFQDEEIWKFIDLGKIYNIIFQQTRAYYHDYKRKLRERTTKSISREEKIEYDIMLGVLTIIKSKKQIYTKSKYFDEAYFLISEKNYDKNQYLYADKTLGAKFGLMEVRAAADWLFYKILKLGKNKISKPQNNSKTQGTYSLTDSIMGKQNKNKNANLDNDISNFLFHIRTFSFLDYIKNNDKNDNLILVEYYWLLQIYKDLNQLYEESLQTNSSKKKIISLINNYLKQVFYYIKMMKFLSTKNLENANTIMVKNKEININRIESENNLYYGKFPVYSYKDINNPLMKFDLGFNEDVFIKKFITDKKININGPLKELYNKYFDRINYLLGILRSNFKNTEFNGGMDLYMNMIKLSLILANDKENQNNNVFKVTNLKMNDEILKFINNSVYNSNNNIKKFPKIYLSYLELSLKSLTYELKNSELCNISKTKLFINLSILGNLRKLSEEEENIFFQLMNDENFIPEKDSKEGASNDNPILIKINKNENNNSIFSFDYGLKDGDDVREKKILDLVHYNFQLRTYLSKESIKLNSFKVYILCINEDEYTSDKNHKKEIIIKEYTKDELADMDLISNTPLNLEHKIFMKYKKGKIYLTKIEFSLCKKENIIYTMDLPIDLNKIIFITNLNKKVLNITKPKDKLIVGLNQFNKFEIEVNKEEIDEVHISQFKMSFVSIPSYYKKSVPSTSMKALLSSKNAPTNKPGQPYSNKVAEQIFGLPKNDKKQDPLGLGSNPTEKQAVKSTKTVNTAQTSMQSFLYNNPYDNKKNVNIQNTENKIPIFPIQKTNTNMPPGNQGQTPQIQNEIIQVPMPSPVFYFYNEEKNTLDSQEKNFEKEYDNVESLLKEGKNKFNVLMKFSLAGQYEMKMNISYSIRHRDIEDYIWFNQEETLKFIVIEPFKFTTQKDSSNILRKTKINADNKEEKSTEYLAEQKVNMNIVLTNQLNEDIIIKDIIIKLNEKLSGENNQDFKLKCPTKDIIDSNNLPPEVKNQILKIIKNADYNIPFETIFNGGFKGSIGKVILKWTTPSLMNFGINGFEINNENEIDFPELIINNQRLKFEYNTATNENNEIMLNIKVQNITNKGIKVIFIIENGEEVNFIVSGMTKQVHNIKANDNLDVIFRLIPLIKNEELKLPTVKICEHNSDTLEKICSYYFFLDKIYII